MEFWKKTEKEWKEAYEKLTKITSFSLDEIRGEHYALVRDRESKYFGQIGLCEGSYSDLDKEVFSIKFKPLGRKRAIRETFVDERRGDKIYSALNLPLIFKEREKLEMLFPDILD